MGFFDKLKNMVKNDIKSDIRSSVNKAENAAANAVYQSAKNAASNSSQKKETFTFTAVPKSVEELKALPEADLTTPFKTTALVMLVLMNYKNDVDGTLAMLNFLKGPEDLSQKEIQFLKDRLVGKEYVPASFFEGATPENDYTPAQPFKITVSDYVYSYQNEGYAMLNIHSSGADDDRQVQLRRKGEQWFLWENFALSDMRIPKSQDKWA